MRKNRGKKCTALMSLKFFDKRRISKKIYCPCTAYHAITIQHLIEKTTNSDYEIAVHWRTSVHTYVIENS